MQIAIDNAKRKFDIDLTKEIKTIKDDMNISENGLPEFWQYTKKDKMKCNNVEEKARRNRENKIKIRSKINSNLNCPMNYLFRLELNKFRNNKSTLPMSDFLIKQDLGMHHRTSRRVEEMIEKYSLELKDFVLNHDGMNWNRYEDELFVLRADFDDLINDIRVIGLSKNYVGLMYWLINRAFEVGSGVKRNKNITDSKVDKNKSILMKVLYEINPKAFLSCFIEKKAAS